jgi:hypothetical protein
MGRDWAIALNLESEHPFVQSTVESNVEGKKPSWIVKPVPDGFALSLPVKANLPAKSRLERRIMD